MQWVDLKEVLALYSKPVFTPAQIANISGIKRESATRLLRRHAAKGRILAVERGKYTLPDTDINSISTSLVSPSYISFLSALLIHGLTTQMPLSIQVVTSRRKEKIKFENTTIEFITFPSDMIFGYERVDENLFVASREKTFLDIVYRQGFCPLEEAMESLADLDEERLVTYVKRTGSAVTAKRIGYFMSTIGIDLRKELRSLISSTWEPLNVYEAADGKKDHNWRIIDNMSDKNDKKKRSDTL